MNKTDEYLQEKIDSFTKAHNGEDPEKILAYMRGKSYTTDDDLDGSIEPEIQKVINENFFDMLNGEEGVSDEFEKEWKEYFKYRGDVATVNLKHLAKHFFELGLKAQKGE